MRKNYQEGKKEDGKYYLRVERLWVEVEEKVYNGYMALVYRENKVEEREARCRINGKRCNGKCSECEHDREGITFSLEQMREDEGFDVKDTNPSVEERILDKFLKDTLHSELRKLSSDDMLIIHDIYYEDVPFTQKEIGKKLRKSQQYVSKRHEELLRELRVQIEKEICCE